MWNRMGQPRWPDEQVAEGQNKWKQTEFATTKPFFVDFCCHCPLFSLSLSRHFRTGNLVGVLQEVFLRPQRQDPSIPQNREKRVSGPKTPMSHPPRRGHFPIASQVTTVKMEFSDSKRFFSGVGGVFRCGPQTPEARGDEISYFQPQDME